MKLLRVIILAVISTFFYWNAAFSQKSNLPQQETKLVKLYSDLYSRMGETYDTLEVYSARFEKAFKHCLQTNPATLDYPFKKLIDKQYCEIKTSTDGRFRFYSWDTWTGGTGHVFIEIIQWKSNNKVQTKILETGEGDGGCYISKLYTVMINDKPHYLAIRNGIYSTRQVGQSIFAYCIDNDQLNVTVTVFKTKTQKLNHIEINFDFFSLDGHPERPLELITFDEKKKILYIPVVDQKDVVTKKNILYELKKDGFQYIGIETGKRK